MIDGDGLVDDGEWLLRASASNNLLWLRLCQVCNHFSKAAAGIPSLASRTKAGGVLGNLFFSLLRPGAPRPPSSFTIETQPSGVAASDTHSSLESDINTKWRKRRARLEYVMEAR